MFYNDVDNISLSLIITGLTTHKVIDKIIDATIEVAHPMSNKNKVFSSADSLKSTSISVTEMTNQKKKKKKNPCKYPGVINHWASRPIQTKVKI